LGVVNVIDKAGVAMGELVFFAHDSTIATNALVERNLARTGLLTTQGFRDVLEYHTPRRVNFQWATTDQFCTGGNSLDHH
jgi:N-methylhydantoinase A